MKYLEIPELEVLSRALNLSTPTMRVTTRVEAYSCKAIARERKFFKNLDTEFIQDMALSSSISPPEQHPGLFESPFGPLDRRESRKTFWLLIGLMNIAFPDHDFSQVRPEDFKREESPRVVLGSLSGALDHLRSSTPQRSFSSYPPSSTIDFVGSPNSEAIPLPIPITPTDGDSLGSNPILRHVLDPVIDLSECEVYSYTPDPDSDPYAFDDDSQDEDDASSPFDEEDDGLDGMEGVTSISEQPRFKWFVQEPRVPLDEDREEPSPTRESPGTLLFSSHYFLHNRRMKRIVFISTAAHGRRSGGINPMVTSFTVGSPSSHLKRSASMSIPLLAASSKRIRAT